MRIKGCECAVDGDKAVLTVTVELKSAAFFEKIVRRRYGHGLAEWTKETPEIMADEEYPQSMSEALMAAGARTVP